MKIPSLSRYIASLHLQRQKLRLAARVNPRMRSLLWTVFFRYQRFLVWSIASYLLLIIELLTLESMTGVLIAGSGIHYLRFLSVLSLVPLLSLFFSDSLAERPSTDQKAYEAMTRDILRIVFYLKILVSALVVVSMFTSTSFRSGVPLILQAIVLARALTSPFDGSVTIALLSKHRRYIPQHALFTRSSGLIADGAGMIFICLNSPVCYLLYFVGLHMLRAEWFLEKTFQLNLKRLFFWNGDEYSSTLLTLKAFMHEYWFVTLLIFFFEYSLLRLGILVARQTTWGGMGMFILHTMYHFTLAISFRANRAKLSLFAQFLAIYAKSTRRALAWSIFRIQCIGTLVSVPFALTAFLPFLIHSWRSPFGEAVELPLVFMMLSVLTAVLRSSLFVALLLCSSLASKVRIWLLLIVASYSALQEILFNSEITALLRLGENVAETAVGVDILCCLIATAIVYRCILTHKAGVIKQSLATRFFSNGRYSGVVCLECIWKKEVREKSVLVERIIADLAPGAVEQYLVSRRRSLFFLRDAEQANSNLLDKLAIFAADLVRHVSSETVTLQSRQLQADTFNPLDLSGGFAMEQVADSTMHRSVSRYLQLIGNEGPLAALVFESKDYYVSRFGDFGSPLELQVRKAKNAS